MRLPRAMLLPALLAALAGTAAAQTPDPDPAPFSEYEVHLEDRTENGAFVIDMGPVSLPAPAHHGPGATHEEMGVFPPVRTVSFPSDAYLEGFSYEVVNGDGERIPTEIVHHLNFITPNRRELFLPISQRLLAVGKETGSQSLPGWLLGVPVEAGTRLVVSPMLHNPTGESHEGVHVRVVLHYRDAGGPFPLLEVYPFQLDVAFPAGDKSVDLPPGPSSFSWEGSPSRSGRIMAVGSHLHELATGIRLEDVTAGEVIWEGRPILGPDGETVEGVTIGRLYRRLGVPITPDHTYRVTVDYYNPGSDTLKSGGMGVVAGVFLPAGDAPWPRIDPDDPLFQLDRRHYMREVRGDFELISSGGGVLGPGSGSHDHAGEHGAPGSDTTEVHRHGESGR